ncbi:GDSL esterase/lipase At5g55050 [Setaria italica]|nr:GDSL esterase/lipase At5g55050 [Setaria italica]
MCAGAHRTVAAGARSPATAMYVFGSSILDVGNNNYLPGASVARANRRYNGIDFPSSIPTGRFSNGYNIADYVAKSMGFASSPPAYLSLAPSSGPLVQNAVANGISYASGGAGILDSTNAGNTIRLSKQVQYFGTTKAKMVAALGPNVANALLSRSIFLIGIGNNDMYVFESAERAQNRSAVEQRRETAVLYGNLISNYTATMRELYSMGARKFAIVNIGLLGCVPAVRVLSPTGECWDSLNQLAGGFNEALRPWLAGLARRLPGLAYSLADLFAFTRDTLADPQASGYTEVAGACCGGGRLRGEAQCSPNSTLCANRDQHVFWDRAHFSQRTAFLIAQAFCNGPAKYTNPVNFMQLAGSVSEITEALESSR